jgi:anti-sigma-K factor RskA
VDHDEARELTAAYALHALDSDEERAFEAHLARCDDCRETVADFEETASALAYDVDSPPPPPALRDRVLAAAAAERPNVVPLRPRWAVPAAGLAAVAAVAAIALGIWAAVLHGDLSDERAAAGPVAEILSDPGARRVPLADGRGSLVVASDGKAALVVSGLGPAPANRVYEAWVIVDGDPRPAGVFDGSRGTTVVPLTRPVPEGAVVAVTVEREPVDAPTGDPVLLTETL